MDWTQIYWNQNGCCRRYDSFPGFFRIRELTLVSAAEVLRRPSSVLRRPRWARLALSRNRNPSRTTTSMIQLRIQKKIFSNTDFIFPRKIQLKTFFEIVRFRWKTFCRHNFARRRFFPNFVSYRVIMKWCNSRHCSLTCWWQLIIINSWFYRTLDPRRF